jgi:hypothetical protein
MQSLEVSGAVRYIYIYIIRRLKGNGTSAGFMKIHALRDVTPCKFASMSYEYTNIHGDSPINTGHHMELP